MLPGQWPVGSHPPALCPLLDVSSFFKSQTHFSSLYFYHCHCHCSSWCKLGTGRALTPLLPSPPAALVPRTSRRAHSRDGDGTASCCQSPRGFCTLVHVPAWHRTPGMLHPAPPQHHFPFAACPRGAWRRVQGLCWCLVKVWLRPHSVLRAPGATAALRTGLEALGVIGSSSSNSFTMSGGTPSTRPFYLTSNTPRV